MIEGVPWVESARIAQRVRVGTVVAGPRGGYAVSDDRNADAVAWLDMDETGPVLVDDPAGTMRVRLFAPNRIVGAG